MYGDSEHFRSAAITTPQFNLLISECFLSVLFLRYDRYRRSQATDGSIDSVSSFGSTEISRRSNQLESRENSWARFGPFEHPPRVLLATSLHGFSLSPLSSIRIVSFSSLSSLLSPLSSFLFSQSPSVAPSRRASERASERARLRVSAILRCNSEALQSRISVAFLFRRAAVASFLLLPFHRSCGGCQDPRWAKTDSALDVGRCRMENNARPLTHWIIRRDAFKRVPSCAILFLIRSAPRKLHTFQWPVDLDPPVDRYPSFSPKFRR